MTGTTERAQEERLAAALERRFTAPVPDASFTARLEQQLIARRRALVAASLAGGATTARHGRIHGLADRLRAHLAVRPFERPPRRLGAAQLAVGIAVAGIVVVLLVGFGAGAEEIAVPADLARTFVERLRGLMPLPSDTPQNDRDALPPTESGPLYLVPDRGIMPLGSDDLVQAESPLVYNTDGVSGTVSALWSDGEGTELYYDLDLSGAAAALRAALPEGVQGRLVYTLELRLPVSTLRSRFIHAMSYQDEYPRATWSIGNTTPEREFRGLPRGLESVDLIVTMDAQTVDSGEMLALQRTGATLPRAEVALTIPLASASRGELTTATPADERLMVHGVELRVSGVVLGADATHVRLEAGTGRAGDEVNLNVPLTGGDKLPALAALIALRDDHGRTYAPKAVPETGWGVEFAHGPLTFQFEPVARDASALTLDVASVIVDTEARQRYDWIEPGGDVPTLAVPLAGPGAVDSHFAFALDKQDRLVFHSTAILGNRVVSVSDHPVRIVSIVPTWQPPAEVTEYYVYVEAGPEHDGRTLLGLWAAAVGRVRWSDWRRIGGWRDLGRAYCGVRSGAGGGSWEVASDGSSTSTLRSWVRHDDFRMHKVNGGIELCFLDPVFRVRGPWVLPLPVTTLHDG